MTKEQLKGYRAIKLERDKLAEMLEELEATMYSPKGQKLDGMPHSGSGIGSPTESLALKHADLRARYEKKVAELTTALSEIEAEIETLAPRERTLIRLHYAEGLTWEQVCVEMSYSWRQIHRLHSKALEALRNTKASE